MKRSFALLSLSALLLAGCTPPALSSSSSALTTSSPTTSVPASSTPTSSAPESSSSTPTSSTPTSSTQEPSSSTPTPTSSTSEPASSTSEPSSSSPESSIDPEAAYKIGKTEMVNYFINGFSNVTVNLTGDLLDGGSYLVMVDGAKAYERGGVSLVYDQITNGIFISAMGNQDGSTIAYESKEGIDVSGFSAAGKMGDLLRYQLIHPEKAFDDSIVLYQSEALDRAEIGALYDAFAYIPSGHYYHYAAPSVSSEGVSLQEGSYYFENGALKAIDYVINNLGELSPLHLRFSAFGTTSVSIPSAAEAALAYHTVSFYYEDGTTLFTKAYIGHGSSGVWLDNYPQKASSSADTYYYLSSWTLDGGDLENVTQDIKATAVFASGNTADLFTRSGDVVTLEQPPYTAALPNLADRLTSLTLPTSWTETTLDLANYSSYPHLAIKLNGTIADITDTGAAVLSQLDFTGNTHFALENNVVLNAAKTIAYGAVNQTITTASLPNTVTTIKASAFEDCAALSSINVPTSLTTINDHAFRGCSSLSSFALPSGLTTLERYAFAGSGITSVTIPSGITSVPQACFSGCHSLASLTLPDTVTTIEPNGFSETPALKIALSLPASLLSVEDSAFSHSGITALSLPEVDIAFGENVFLGCDGLSSVTIPAALTAIGGSMFEACTNLTRVTFASGSQLTDVGRFAFSGSALTSIHLPSGVTDLGDYAFARNPALTSADFSACTALEEISNDCFLNDVALTTVSLPASLTTLRDKCFANTGIKTFTIPSTMTYLYGAPFWGSGTTIIDERTSSEVFNDVAYHEGSVQGDAMLALTDAASYVAPSHLMTIEDYAFAGRHALQSLDLSAITSGVPLLHIGSYAFAETGLTSIAFPSGNSNTKIQAGERAFSGLASLTSILLPSSVNSLGVRCFADDPSLKSADLGNSGLTALPSGLFENDTALESVILPEGLTSLSYGIFLNCVSLKAIYSMEESPLDTSVYEPITTVNTGWNCIDVPTRGASQGVSTYAPYYLYSKAQPSTNPGAYWHYVNGVPSVWSAA